MHHLLSQLAGATRDRPAHILTGHLALARGGTKESTNLVRTEASRILGDVSNVVGDDVIAIINGKKRAPYKPPCY
jgi:hypothetical protein